MDMLSGSQIDSFLSATSLVWVSSIVLIMVGLIYFIKYKESNESIKNSPFFSLYFLTILLNVLEYLLNIVMHNNPPYETVVYKVYILLKFFWNILMMFYVINYIYVNDKEKIKFFGIIKILLMVIVTIISLTLNVNIALENNGKFYILVGALNNIYRAYAIASNSILLLIILIFRKKMPKGFCFLSIVTYLIYIGILAFKHFTGYMVNESVFIYSLLVLIIFNTTSNQDKELVNVLNMKIDNLASVNKRRNMLISNINNYFGESTNDIVLFNNDLYLNNDYNKELIEKESKDIENTINEITDYLDDIKYTYMMEYSKSINNDYQLSTLIKSINDKLLPLVNNKNINFKVSVGQNSFLKYIGDIKKVEIIVCNIMYYVINNCDNGEDINLNITSKLNSLNDIELSFTIKSNGKPIIDLTKFSVNDYLENSKNYNKYDLRLLIAIDLLNQLNSNLNIKTDDNKTIYYFTVIEGFKDSELFYNMN